MFASSGTSRRTSASWLEPGRGGRRRHRRRSYHGGRGPRVGTWLIVLLVLAAAGAAGYAYLRHRNQVDDQRAAGQRFLAAYARGDERAMFDELDVRSRAAYPYARFARSYRSAESAAGVTRITVGPATGPKGGAVSAPAVVRTRFFGTLRGTIAVPVHAEGDHAAIAWSPYLRLPGLRKGEQVVRRTLQVPTRATVFGADGLPMADNPSTTDIAKGLDHVYDARLAGTPGAQLRFGDRVIARVKATRGRSVHATIRPGLQRAAAAALGSRLGGVAVVRPRDGSVLALAGLAVSAPQPPGSTFKIITLSGVLTAGIAKPSDSFPVRSAATLSGVLLRNASNEQCGGSLTSSFANSCNSVFAPLGAKLGAERLVRTAEAFGFNETPKVPAAKPSTIPQPSQLKDDLAVGASAIGQNRDLATPLGMAIVGATIAERGRHPRPRIVRSEPVRRNRAVSAKVAGEVRDMMLAVVRGGTGTAAALPGVQVAGKTGTAELRPTAGGPPDPRNTDAWFVAFAPAYAPRVAVAVMLVGAGAGGKAAAPIARQVLQAALSGS
ncbi:MAG: penicillin-binding transpeptidase domain-containing protein [Solirubrobacteraceae bacterium]